MSVTPTPKQPQPERRKDWYPYYAGFSSDFVGRTLSQHFTAAASLIDPWNGSGTTTAVGAARGKSCIGLDINPAVTVIARARLTPVVVQDSLVPIAKEIVIASGREVPPRREVDPLHDWLRWPAVEAFRRLQRGIHRVVVGDHDLELEIAHEPELSTSTLPMLATFFYAALFAAARDVLKPFRSSNPTWLRYPESYRRRLNPAAEIVASLFIQRVGYLATRLSLPSEARAARATVRTGSVLHLKGDGIYDACLTSPPYATRVDYVRTTLAELSILGLASDQIDDLRRSTTGTPVVRGVTSAKAELMSPMANRLVETVKSHESHGSSNYYAPWIQNYLGSLETSLSLINRAVVQRGTIAVVVQDSHYKSHHVDLQGIVTDTLEGMGRRLRTRVDYPVRHSLARMNPTARKHLAQREVAESLLVFS